MRWPRRRPRAATFDPGEPDKVLRPVPDDLPKDGIFEQPLRVHRIKGNEPESIDGDWRVAFVVFVRDAAGRTCPDIAVDATIAGPERTASGQATTDLMGRATFRMRGPAGGYQLTVDDIAAGALAWQADGNERASISV